MKEDLKVTSIGTIGFMASISLADVALLLSMLVSVATVVYVVSKTILLWRNSKTNGKN